MKVAICTGKTGGHVFPALAVARELKRRSQFNEPFFIGTHGGLDEGVLQREGFRFEAISGCGLPTHLSWGTLKWVKGLGLGLAQVRQLFKIRKPDIVLSFGGYISCAPVLMAHWMKIPVVIHESNIRPGRANRFLSRWAKVICKSFPTDWSPDMGGREMGDRIQVTGLPLREKFFSVDRARGLQYLGIDPEKFVILVMGGSLGSQRINECLVEALHDLGDLSKRIQIIHVTGHRDYARVLQKYEPNGISYKAYPFLDEVECAFACANLFIGRAGASTLAEITYCGLPAILVPYPYAVEDHQWANATYLAREGAVCVLEEGQLSARVLADEMIRLVLNDRLRMSMAQNAKRFGVADGASRIVAVLENVLEGEQ